MLIGGGPAAGTPTRRQNGVLKDPQALAGLSSHAPPVADMALAIVNTGRVEAAMTAASQYLELYESPVLAISGGPSSGTPTNQEVIPLSYG